MLELLSIAHLSTFNEHHKCMSQMVFTDGHPSGCHNSFPNITPTLHGGQSKTEIAI